jgi:hypothetical protein
MVRVIKQPTGWANGLEMSRFKEGRTYDLHPSLADYLVLEGYAIIEMRRSSRSRRYRPNDRRRIH